MIVKICGITSLDDAKMALAAGADWVGLNLVAGPRRVTPETACGIINSLPNPRQAVALVALSESDEERAIHKMLHLAGVRRLQLYGHCPGARIAALHEDGFETIYVHSVSSAACIDRINSFFTTSPSVKPDFVLLDASDPNRLGGTGRLANWEAIAQADKAGNTEHWPPIILAGGLNPDNVAEAIHTVRPTGVDVSSGVESSPGHKDPAKVSDFVRIARTHEKR